MSTPSDTPNKHTVDGFVNGVPANWKQTAAQPVPVVRCTTIKKDGQRCRRFSIRGGTVCYRHGGNLPNVQERAQAIVEAARMRIVNDVDDALDTLEDLLKPGTAEAIRLKSATELLDRAGLKNAIEVNVEVTNHGPDPAAQIRERMARLVTSTPLALEEEQIQEAEVIAEDDVPVEDTLF